MAIRDPTDMKQEAQKRLLDDFSAAQKSRAQVNNKEYASFFTKTITQAETVKKRSRQKASRGNCGGREQD